MYGAADLPKVNRTESERNSDHPLMQAWMDMRVSKSFSRDDVRDWVAPVYMGLIKELDDQMGRLFSYLTDAGRMDDTMIVFCSDHGDNMGDHWMGEKDLFHDCSSRIPLIIYDPRSEADKSRGTSTDALIEGIDLAPTFLDYFGGEQLPHLMEGRSLTSLLHNHASDWRQYCVSEYDYSTRDARRALQIDQADARLVMVFDGRWKYIHVEKMRPMLFDLRTDPDEVCDLGGNEAYADQLARMSEMHFEWSRKHHNRITRSASVIEKMADAKEPPGILIGYVDRDEVEKDKLPWPAHADR